MPTWWISLALLAVAPPSAAALAAPSCAQAWQAADAPASVAAPCQSSPALEAEARRLLEVAAQHMTHTLACADGPGHEVRAELRQACLESGPRGQRRLRIDYCFARRASPAHDDCDGLSLCDQDGATALSAHRVALPLRRAGARHRLQVPARLPGMQPHPHSPLDRAHDSGCLGRSEPFRAVAIELPPPQTRHTLREGQRVQVAGGLSAQLRRGGHKHGGQGGGVEFWQLDLTRQGQTRSLGYAHDSDDLAWYLEDLAHGMLVTLERLPASSDGGGDEALWLLTLQRQRGPARSREQLEEAAAELAGDEARQRGCQSDGGSTAQASPGSLRVVRTRGKAIACRLIVGLYSGRVFYSAGSPAPPEDL